MMGTNNIGRFWIRNFLRREGFLPHCGMEIRMSPRSEACKGEGFTRKT